MKSLMGSIRRRWLGLRPEETSFARRGFRGATAEMQARLERVGATFVAGYHAALENNSPEAVAQDLAHIEPELRGFAFEGAAMGLALLDRLTPWRANRVQGFLRGAGDAHAYMVQVGIGWLWARMPAGFRRRGVGICGADSASPPPMQAVRMKPRSRICVSVPARAGRNWRKARRSRPRLANARATSPPKPIAPQKFSVACPLTKPRASPMPRWKIFRSILPNPPTKSGADGFNFTLLLRDNSWKPE